MAALSSNSGEWMTPTWLVEKCRAALGGYITLDPATSASNPVGADLFYTADDNALAQPWDWDASFKTSPNPTLFLNPPGERTGKLIRKFWDRWNYFSSMAHFKTSVWVDFNLDHLRFLERVPGDCLIIPRKRMAFLDPVTGLERKGAQIGGFIYFRGAYRNVDKLFPPGEFLAML